MENLFHETLQAYRLGDLRSLGLLGSPVTLLLI